MTLPSFDREQRDLRIQRIAPGPVVELVQSGAEQKDQVAEEIALEQEGGPGLRAGDFDILIPQRNHTRPSADR